MNGRRDYSALIEQLLADYHVWKAGETKWRSACPIHKGDNPTSFSIFINGRFNCFRCGANGDITRLVMAVRGLSLKQAQDFIGSAPVAKSFFPDTPLMAKTWKEAKSGVSYPILRDAVLGPYRSHCPSYLVSRGFSESVLKTFEIGYDLQHAKIVIPVRDWKRRLVGLTYRLDFDNDKQQKAKYWHDNFLKNLHLYGFYFHAGKPLKHLFLVEGQLDVVRMRQLGYAAAAVMGDNISEDQVQLLRQHCRADQVVLAFDNDPAGQECTAKVIDKLARTSYGPGLGLLKYDEKDPGELTENSRMTIAPCHSWNPLERPCKMGNHALYRGARKAGMR